MVKNHISSFCFIILIIEMLGPLSILFPSSIEASTSGRVNKGFKSDFGFFMITFNRLGMNFSHIEPSSIGISHALGMTKGIDIVNKGGAKVSSGFVEFGDSDGLNAAGNSETMFKKCSCKIDNYSTKECTGKENNVIDKFVHSGYFPICTFMIGVVATAMYFAFEFRSRF